MNKPLPILLALLALPLMAADTEWTQFGGPNRNFTSNETKLLDHWPEEGPKELWRQKIGQGFSSPIAVDGKIYCLGVLDQNDTLTCIDAADGHILWSDPGDSSFTDSMPGSRATPAVDDQFIYTFGGKGQLVCRNLVDGKQQWSLNILDETEATVPGWGCSSAPTIRGDMIYLQVGDKGPIVVAVDKKLRKIAWKSEETGPASYSAVVPATLDGKTQLLVYAGKGVFALDPDTGKTLWKIPLKNLNDSAVSGVPPIYSGGHLLLTSGYGDGAAMFKVDGKPGSTPECLWEKKVPSTYVVPPLLEAEHLYITNENALHCLHWPDGEELWHTDLALGGGGQYVRYADKMILLTRTGELLLATVTPKECTVLSKCKPFDDKQICATPLIYRGRLYLKGPSDLVCYDIHQNP